MKFEVGNGQNILLWLDNWHPKGPLLGVYSSNVLFASGLPLNGRLSDVITAGVWTWPHARSFEMMDLQATASHITPSTDPDSIIWIPTQSKSFHLGSTWNFLRPHYSKVSWYSLVWFKEVIPKHAFICWLTILDRLSTKARQHKFNPDIEPHCIFCGSTETRDHLFFACSYSSSV